ncbi:response regulator transcription factor [Micromonospora sp. NPDC049374]|uniref:response regulator transcription factor n=1 Tax=Micromonospora sp. NPDC049374 TaxID=3154352 RepID=UPI00342CFFFE
MTTESADRSTSIRVLVADDQPLLRHSLALLIDGTAGLTVVGQAATGHEAVSLTRERRPDVVLMDIRMPDGDGIEATGRIAAATDLSGTRVLVLSMFALDEYVAAALRAGAHGFLLKDAHPDQLVDAIRRTHAGESLFAPSILTRFVAHYLDRPGPPEVGKIDRLTGRETEVLSLVARGLSNDEIARTLNISIKTVKTHVGNLLTKLDARDRAQLVIAAYENDLVAPRSSA